jgi:hypothetical protein
MTDGLEIVREYSYAHAPTIKRFSQSRAFIRGLMGPFGSGKSSGCVIELVKWAKRQPLVNGKRRARFACIRNCYDDRTEILTELRGWRLFKDLLESDRVAMLQDGKLVFTHPSYYYSADYVGQMIGHRNEGVDFLVTPDHKLSVSMRNARRKTWSEYRLRTAADCYGKTNMRVRRSAEWEGATDLSEHFFEWLGYWFAEGSTTIKEYDGSMRHNCVINTKHDRDYARRVFQAAGLPYTERERGDGVTTFRLRVTFETRPLILKLAECGKEITKSVPAEWRNAPREHLRRFLAGYLAGDGHHRTDGVIRASTASKALADDLQEIALRAGEVVNTSTVARREGLMVINGVTTRQNANTHVLSFLSPKKHSPYLTAEGWYTQTYRGKVYCLEVPTHIVYVRRGGKAFWCSQTYPQLGDTTIKTFLDWLPDRVFGVYAKADHAYYLNRLDDLEVEILFRALDRPEHVSNLLSLELTGAWVNEAREVPWTVINALKGRVDRYPARRDGGCVDPGIIMDTNPPDDDSWWYKLFEENTDAEDGRSVEIFKQPSGRSPEAENLPNLSPDYYRNLMGGADPDFIRVYVDGLYGYVRDGKPVYPEYNDAVHCSPGLEPVKGVKIKRGWDFGLTPACAFTQVTPDGRWFVVDELCGDDIGITSFADCVLEMSEQRFPGFMFEDYGDPAGQQRSAMTADKDEKTCFDILRGKGINILPAGQNLTLRLESVRKPLNTLRDGKPQFQISPRCEMLRKGFLGRYQFRRVKVSGSAERYHDEPEKNEYSHPHDALQYAASSVFGGVVRGHDTRNRYTPIKYPKMGTYV